ncbi:MAG: hypothetical protein RL462_457 [Pseudomonadota bacterium]|jgi:hypothetical protein
MTTKTTTTRRASKANERPQTTPNDAMQGADTLTPDKSNAAQRPDIEPAFSENSDASAMMMALWRKAAPAMTEGELAWVAGAGEEVSASLNGITRLLTGLACLDGELEDLKNPTLDRVKITSILFSLIGQLEVLSSLSFISGDAVHKLLKPSLYREGGPLQGL